MPWKTRRTAATAAVQAARWRGRRASTARCRPRGRRALLGGEARELDEACRVAAPPGGAIARGERAAPFVGRARRRQADNGKSVTARPAARASRIGVNRGRRRRKARVVDNRRRGGVGLVPGDDELDVVGAGGGDLVEQRSVGPAGVLGEQAERDAAHRRRAQCCGRRHEGHEAERANEHHRPPQCILCAVRLSRSF